MITFDQELDKICELATKTWGQQTQEQVAIGELGELLTMFGRRAQNRDTKEAWIDEIADCLIMLRQLALLHGSKEVDERIAKKISKLKVRLEPYIQNKEIP
jgi:NTP pyrophosphatase (non-canonical NTP hydrolase)